MTNAENRAVKAAQLPGFRGVALGAIKDSVSQMLHMIGYSNDIFSTYTKHDISHIDAMLQHLDWLIPPTSQSVMTEVDWLLITLAIYFHDLGMVVTHAEFEQREKNAPFQSFLSRLKKPDPKSQAYMARASKMTPSERDRFFFQEFVRENHAERIREWITGRHSHAWSVGVRVITEEISKILEPLPSRFRENLATVCESHHKDDLNKLDKYPLCQRYGSGSSEMANVQYAALVLRTVDLIHVTKDRTPSIMYKTIRFSDPKGVEEWDKQKGAFAVHHAGRTFSADDQQTHQILVAADFTEEKPFFALTEYLAWADSEIKQTKRWCDQSRELADGEAFWLPWQGIRGDLRVEGNQPQQMRFEFDRGRLLELLVGHAIYNEPTVAIRELLQNAIDAVRFQKYLKSKQASDKSESTYSQEGVTVFWHQESNQLSVEDTGTGMDLDIIKFHLMRVGSSFYDTPQFSSEFHGFTPISRFGIGVLTCFMISDDIEIITCKKGKGHRIRMTSVQADYLLRDLLPGDPLLEGIAPHGTRVTLKLREGVNFAKRSLEDILRYWIVLPACPVRFKSGNNATIQIGYKSPKEALESYFEQDDKFDPSLPDRVEIVSKQMIVDGATYEMAYAVRKGWLPERTFAVSPKRGLPAVCVEGICVAEKFPGFSSERGVSGIVSVRGARGLRTTVSRSGLEEDSASVKLGEICAEMLFEHIRGEVQLIASGRGTPLSRASTGGKWLCQDLKSGVLSRPVLEQLQKMRRQLDLIVVETRNQEKGVAAWERKLVSPTVLADLSEFWTIESRLVDSLGLISRDLGRELSLNEFLTALAPDFNELDFFPLIPDAHQFADDIREGHVPGLVRYSRAHQQTAIKWQKKTISAIPENHVEREAVLSFSRRVRSELLRENSGRRFSPDFVFIDYEPPIAVADMEGDEAKVEVVRTRMLVIVKPDSIHAQAFQLIQKALQTAKDANAHVAFARLWNMREFFAASFFNRFSDEFNDTERSWRNSMTESAPIFEASGISLVDLPGSLAPVDPASVFDATSYWRDWYRDR